MSRRAAATIETEVMQWKGPEALRSMLSPIEHLHEDAGNVNTHDDESIARIAASYARFGQQRPCVADEAGVIRAGNGQLRAAIKLGWTHLAVVTSDLSGVDLAGYALADNRTAQFSRLDDLRVAELCRALQSEESFPIEATGYTDAEVEELLERIGSEHAGAGGGEDQGGESEEPPAPRPSLAERFIVPPFSVLDARQGYWQDRKRQWIELGIQSELGRGGGVHQYSEAATISRQGGTIGHDGSTVYRERGEGDYSRSGAVVAPGGGMADSHVRIRQHDRQSAGGNPNATPGGSLMPAADYRNRERGDGRGRPIGGG